VLYPQCWERNATCLSVCFIPFHHGSVTDLSWKTAAGMIGDAKDSAATLKWYAELFQRPFTWSSEVREDVNTAVVDLVAWFLSAEGAHRKAHGITATTKKAIVKESTSYREYVDSKRLELHWVRTPGPTDNEVIWEEWRSKRMPRPFAGEEGSLFGHLPNGSSSMPARKLPVTGISTLRTLMRELRMLRKVFLYF
jgi:hypothetical protein